MVKYFTFLFCCIVFTGIQAQKATFSGTITDSGGSPIIGANVTASPGNIGTITDVSGDYSFTLDPGMYTISASFIGYSTQMINVTLGTRETRIWNVSMADDAIRLEDVVLVGSRSAPRSNTTSPLPIDVLSAKDIMGTGQTTFDKALQYRIPSFNTVQTPVNDATSLLDPYEIRNMGPSRTLILINGKRKNMSSLVYVQTSPGRGETGADISAIPTDAIERVEILRDGASAQYGSDAIAGVMNVILKKKVNYGSATIRGGATSKGDGEMLGLSINQGLSVGEKGFVNYTIDFSKIDLANRPGKVDAAAEADDVLGFGAPLADVQAFLNKYPDAGNINGSPATASAKFLVNGGHKLNANSEIYYNAAYVYKKVNSFANYRTPYWRTLSDFPYLLDLFGDGKDPKSYKGYVPTFTGDLNDYNATVGYKTSMNGWQTDASLTTGGNEQTYNVSNTHNRSTDANGNFIYGALTPISFKPGGTSFKHIVGNIDISKPISDKISVAFGSEFRSENFEVIQGDEASYVGLGADSFQGNTPANSGKFNRYNVGAYLDLSFDVTKDFLINGTARHEEYSDFGGATVWKMSSRYKLFDDKFTLRASVSTGFRAPSLHQIYTEKSQSSFQPGGAIVITGIINNVSSAARANGVPALSPEKSNNITFGFGFKPTKDFNLTVDYYDIKVKDRIILGEKIDFAQTGDGGQAFFVNAMDSKTSGIDFVAGYKNVPLGSGSLGFNLAGNYTITNKRDGAIKNPASVAALPGNLSVLSATQEALLFTSRPKFKAILGLDYEIGKFGFSINNTLFGPTKFKNDGMDSNLRIEFLTKIVSDLGISFAASDKVTIALNVNNFLNVVPEWVFKAENAAGTTLINNAELIKRQSNLITFNNRYALTTYDGSHFSQLGTMFNGAVNVKF
ncbi:MAG: TonB-dependent receptor [Saprospiraceae bacterium]|nr:TonB-dependent receptor [Saprospiraceae bacterium]